MEDLADHDVLVRVLTLFELCEQLLIEVHEQLHVGEQRLNLGRIH